MSSVNKDIKILNDVKEKVKNKINEYNNNILDLLNNDINDKILIIGISNGYISDLNRFNSKHIKDNFNNNSVYSISFMKPEYDLNKEVPFRTFELDLGDIGKNKDDFDFLKKLNNKFNEIYFDRGTYHHLSNYVNYQTNYDIIKLLYESLKENGKLYIPIETISRTNQEFVNIIFGGNPELLNKGFSQNNISYEDNAIFVKDDRYLIYSHYLYTSEPIKYKNIFNTIDAKYINNHNLEILKKITNNNVSIVDTARLQHICAIKLNYQTGNNMCMMSSYVLTKKNNNISNNTEFKQQEKYVLAKNEILKFINENISEYENYSEQIEAYLNSIANSSNDNELINFAILILVKLFENNYSDLDQIKQMIKELK